jgi:hypothetical protein
MKANPQPVVNSLVLSMMFTQIISGGQTGVDRAALDVSLELGLPCGGWCPQGRKAEDGPIDPHYPLRETPSADYAERTACNVRDADGTLVLTRGRRKGGTALTIAFARHLNKPCLVLNLNKKPTPARVRDWAKANQVRVLNVAGPRESENQGIYDQAVEFLRRLLSGGVHSSPVSLR